MLAQKQDHEIFMITIKDIKKVLNSKLYTNSQSLISKEYHNLINIFNKKHADKLAPHYDEYNFKIKLKLSKIF